MATSRLHAPTKGSNTPQGRLVDVNDVVASKIHTLDHISTSKAWSLHQRSLSHSHHPISIHFICSHLPEGNRCCQRSHGHSRSAADLGQRLPLFLSLGPCTRLQMLNKKYAGCCNNKVRNRFIGPWRYSSSIE